MTSSQGQNAKHSLDLSSHGLKPFVCWQLGMLVGVGSWDEGERGFGAYNMAK